MFKRFAVSVLGAIMLLALASFAAPSVAKADPYCTEYLYDPPFNVCVAYSMPPGGHACTSGTPAANEVFLYSATNYGGVCAVLPHNSWIPDLGPSGWKNSIRSMKHGTSESSRACNGVNFAPNCSNMGLGYGAYFPNTAGSLNWGSIQTG